MISKKKRLKLEVMMDRIKTLKEGELEKLSNEIEAEILFRDEEYFNRIHTNPDYYKSTEDKENV